jgi:hypothetical protein
MERGSPKLRKCHCVSGFWGCGISDMIVQYEDIASYCGLGNGVNTN